MKKSTEPNSALTFLTIVMMLLFTTGISFGITAFNHNNGLFAIASVLSFTSLMFGCINILR